jgi:ATP-dependent protease ClpP protease subunit
MIDTPAAHRRIQAFAPTNKHWFRIENKKSDDVATIRIHDAIGMWAVTAQDFVRELNAIEASTIHLHINSPGGDVFDGLTIYNALREHPAKVIVHVDALAASIASIIALAGDEVLMAKGSMYMIHNPFSVVIGDARDMRKMADTLEKIGGSLGGIYTDATGMSTEEVQVLMDDETWLTAQETVDMGFATRVKDEPSAKASFDLSVFNKVPAELVAQQNEPSEPEPKTIRDAERALRDAGFSRAEARAIVAGGYKADAEPRDEDAPEEQDNAAVSAAVKELEAVINAARLAHAIRN